MSWGWNRASKCDSGPDIRGLRDKSRQPSGGHRGNVVNQKSGARAEKRSRVTLGLGIVLAAALTLLPTLASAQAPTQQNDNVEVVGRWSFSAEQLSSGEVKGDVLRDLDGPRPPEFPDLDEHNLCWKFLGNGGRLEVQDGQSEGSFKFSNGDTIVIEAWVNLTGLPDGSHAYVIGIGDWSEIKSLPVRAR